MALAGRPAPPAAALPWTVRRFFEQLAELGPLRVITTSGPSVFETICEVGSFGVAEGYLNAITPIYHWHLELARCRFLRSGDRIHARSGRQVLFFELAEGPQHEPFVAIYLHRPKGEEFAADRAAHFAALHAQLAVGVELQGPEAA